jgi:DDE domain
MRERGTVADHTAVFRWVQRDAPELDRRCRHSLFATNDSYRVDETYIKIKKQWHYLYRAVESAGATMAFMLSAGRDADAAERFFHQVLQASHALIPRVITAKQPTPTSTFTPPLLSPVRAPLCMGSLGAQNASTTPLHRARLFPAWTLRLGCPCVPPLSPEAQHCGRPR